MEMVVPDTFEEKKPSLPLQFLWGIRGWIGVRGSTI
jgi:hypothetical protein